jgi:hypothetical protein
MAYALAPNFNLSSSNSRLELRESSPVYAHLPLVEQLAPKTLTRIQNPAGRNLSEKTVVALSSTELGASLTRHILKLVPSVGPHHPAVRCLEGVSSGLHLLIGSAVHIGHGVADLNKSLEIGDGEGMRRAGSNIASGSILSTASALSLAYHSTVIAISGLHIASTAFHGLGSLLTMGLSGLNGYRSAIFRSRINDRMECKKLTEKERVVKTLEFLKEKIAPTDKEREGIVKEVEKLHPRWNSEQIASEVKVKLADLAEVKARYIERRTSPYIVERLLMEVDNLLEQLRGPSKPMHRLDEVKALAQAKSLIDKTLYENKKNLLINGVLAAASFISFAALVLSTFFSLGGLPLVLYAVSSAIALIVLLYPLAIEFFHNAKPHSMHSQMDLTPVSVISYSDAS